MKCSLILYTKFTFLEKDLLYSRHGKKKKTTSFWMKNISSAFDCLSLGWVFKQAFKSSLSHVFISMDAHLFSSLCASLTHTYKLVIVTQEDI